MIGFGISKLSIIPGRAEPSDKAENITQVLFGEHYSVLNEEEKWLKIKLAHDGYECWIDRKQHTPISEEEYRDISSHNNPRSLDLLGIAKDPAIDNYFNLPMGSQLSLFEDGHFQVADSTFEFKGTIAVPDTENLLPYAHLYLNAPYLWGGRTPFGIDCSGFVQIVFALIGIKLPRDAYQQAEVGEEIKDLSTVKPGDVAFFKNPEGRITHVGILTDPDKIIHASGQVRVEGFDQRGIYNVEMKGYSHDFHSVRRMF